MKWKEKRFHSLDYYYKNLFGCKVQKISLDGGMTCPNRDGTLGYGGCIFCSQAGSGDFSTHQCENVTKQIDTAIHNMSPKKVSDGKYIAYFQSYTNTYASFSYLKNLFTEAISHPDIVGISIGTRPDCLPNDVIDMLAGLNRIKPVWVELGLQTIHEETASFIRRGYTLDVYDDALKQLTGAGLHVVTHVIIGLPYESREQMLETVKYVGRSATEGIKLQLLHVIKGTDLEKYMGTFHILDEDEYIDIIISALELLPPEMVIHRLTGDGPADLLIAPLWSLKKRNVLNHINSALKNRDTWQGKAFNQK